MGRYQQVDRAYEFLVEKEREGEVFTIEQLADATGWKVATCRTYPSKRWHQYVENENGVYTPSGVRFLSKDEFRALHSQVLQATQDYSAKGILLHKAKEFALLAVSVYNNPYTEFKTYGFIVNIVVAFTSLFHAIFEKKGESFFYLDKDGKPEIVDGDKKAWELSECAKSYWDGKHAAEHENLKFLVGLRNKIEHRSLPAVDLAVAGECQSALSNFESLIVSEFGENHALAQSLAIAMQMSRVTEQAQIEALKQLQTENYKVVREYMESFRKDLADDVVESQKYRVRAFLVPKLGNHAKSSDLAVEFINVDKLSAEEVKMYEEGVAFIKGIESPYKLKPKKVVSMVQKNIPEFNMVLHTKCWKYFNVRPHEVKAGYKGEFCAYVEGFDGYLYSKKWVDYLLKKLVDENVLLKVRGQKL